jgi:uncharacterized protein (TIGR00299 family) protein
VKLLYLDCFGGISGDMLLGALIDAGVSLEAIQCQLQSLELGGYTLRAYNQESHGITGVKIAVEVEEKHQPHRTWRNIRHLIENSGLEPVIKETVYKVFKRLAEAEGKVHGVDPEMVHFHEIGAVDSIVDITGIAIALHELGVKKVVSSSLPTGYGYVKTRHGLLPIPAPATAELLKGLPLRSLNVEGELVTPTGASLVATLVDSFGPLPAMNISSIGYGMGSNDYGLANFTRVFIGQEINVAVPENAPEAPSQEITLLQTSIDDLSPEILGYTMERLFEQGALDVFVTPVIMKKGRAGSLLTVLCLPEKENTLLKIILAETTTLGVRLHREKRFFLPRRIINVETEYGSVSVKIAGLNGKDISDGQISPEYEDCRQIALANNVSIKKVFQAALFAAQKKLNL